MVRVLCIEVEDAPQDYKRSLLISALIKSVQAHLQTLQRFVFFKSTSLSARMKTWSLPVLCWLPAFSKSRHPYAPRVILFCE